MSIQLKRLALHSKNKFIYLIPMLSFNKHLLTVTIRGLLLEIDFRLIVPQVDAFTTRLKLYLQFQVCQGDIL